MDTQKLYGLSMKLPPKLQQLVQLSSDLDELADLLHHIQNSPQELSLLPHALALCSYKQIEEMSAYCVEILPVEIGGVLIGALSTEQKSQIEKSSAIRLPVALAGEYGDTPWIEFLQQHWPQLIHNCVENSVAIFQKTAKEEARMLQIIPNMLKDALITTIQEKVLLSYIDNLTTQQLALYVKANDDNNRSAHPQLRARHEYLLLNDATKEMSHAARRPIKI